MKCMHTTGEPSASTCKEDATWRGRCPAHGGTHPTVPELMILLGQLTGLGDQSLSVDVGYKRRRDYDDQTDNSYLNDHAWGFTAYTKVIGQDHTVGAQGETLEAALWCLCEEVARRVEDIGRRKAEAATKTQDAFVTFIMQRTRATDENAAGPYR